MTDSAADRRAQRIADLRITYDLGTLSESDLAASPLEQFHDWLADAVAHDVVDPTGMVLSTASADGSPSSRSVLLKGADDRGFAFFSYLGSRKAQDLGENPRVSLCFPWYSRHRQVVVLGTAERLPDDETVAYYRSRPHDSQVGAHTSRQSQVVADREVIEQRFVDLLEQFPPGHPVPVPAVWAGWLVRPASIEFWQGRPSRLHDRLRFRWTADGVPRLGTSDGWTLERLAP